MSSAKKELNIESIYGHLFADKCLNCKDILEYGGECIIVTKYFPWWYHTDLKGFCTKSLGNQENSCTKIIHKFIINFYVFN